MIQEERTGKMQIRNGAEKDKKERKNKAIT